MSKKTTSPQNTKQIIAFLAIAAVVAFVSVLGSQLTTPRIPNWYADLIKAPLTPPNAIFGPVWTLLYIMMAIAAFLVWRKGFAKKTVRVALVAFAVQLALNLLWSGLFFGLQQPLLALGNIILLWLAIIWTIVLFRPISKPAAWLLVPYLAWVSFATYLNAAIWWLNR